MICLSTRSVKMTLSVFVPMLVFSLAQSARGQDYAEAVLADTPTAYYRLGEAAGSTTIANSFGDGEDGTVTAGGGVTFGHPGAVGDTDTSAYFNGGGWITVLDDNFALDLETGKPFTMEYWFSPESYPEGGNYHHVSRTGGDPIHADAFIVHDAAGAVKFHTDGWGGGRHRSDTPGGVATVGDGSWYHVVGTYNGSNEMSIYVNGELHNTSTNVNVGPQAAPEGDFFIGTLGIATGGNDYKGFLDEVAIYNGTALSQERVLAHFDAAFGPPIPIPERAWNVDASANWNEGGNWTPFGVPDNVSQDLGQTVTFGGVTTAPRVVVTETDVSVKAINFLSGNSYAIAGHGTVSLDAGTSGPSTMDVLLGDHEFQAPVSLNNDTEVTLSSGSSLTFNNALSLNDNTLTKFGDGELKIRNDLVTSGGVIDVQGGSVSGNGTVGGDLANAAGKVAPGNSPGILSVDGNYTQSAGGTLEIELASNGGVAGTDHDRLAVTLAASLDGALDLQLDGGYSPTIGDSFAGIVTAGALSGQFATASNVVIDGRRGVAVTYTGTSVDAQIGLRGNTDIASGDIDVDTSDLTTSIINFTSAGGTGKTWADGDMDGDGDVDTSDLTTSIINFTSALGTSSAVPEPSSLMLLLLGTLGCGCLRRRPSR